MGKTSSFVAGRRTLDADPNLPERLPDRGKLPRGGSLPRCAGHMPSASPLSRASALRVTGSRTGHWRLQERVYSRRHTVFDDGSIEFAIHVEVRPKAGVADPPGATIERSLPALGFDGVRDVTVGKSFRFVISDADETACSPARTASSTSWKP